MTNSILKAWSTSTSSHNVVVAMVCIWVILVSTSSLNAQGVRNVFDDLVRGTARVADDIPVKKVDELIADLGKSRAAREAVDTELRKAGQLAETGSVVRGATRSDEVLRLLRTATSELDPTVIRRIEQLDDASRDIALVLARGGDELTRTVPDLASRGRLVREGGPETIAAVGLFGPDAARAALRLDEAIKGGTVIVKDGGRAVALADFGTAMTRYGDASWKFWKEYVQPHWKVWATTGALAAYLANPEYFQDTAGQLTETGFQRLTEFVGEIAAASVRGIGKGSGDAVQRTKTAIWETYFGGANGVYAVLGTIAFLLGASLLFRRVRGWIFRPFKWLNQMPSAAKTQSSTPDRKR